MFILNIFDLFFGSSDTPSFDFKTIKKNNPEKAAFIELLFGPGAGEILNQVPKGKKGKSKLNLNQIFNLMMQQGQSPFGPQGQLQQGGVNAFNSALSNIFGANQAGGDGSAAGFARGITEDDRAQRDQFLGRVPGPISPELMGLSNQLANTQLESDFRNLTSGDFADQLNQRFSGAVGNAAQRGLGLGSSPVLQAGAEVEKRRITGLEDALSKANQTRFQSLFQGRGQDQTANLQGANILNQGATSAFGNIGNLIGAFTGAGGLGLQGQGQGFDQVAALLKALSTDRGNRQGLKITNAAGNAGFGVS